MVNMKETSSDEMAPSRVTWKQKHPLTDCQLTRDAFTLPSGPQSRFSMIPLDVRFYWGTGGVLYPSVKYVEDIVRHIQLLSSFAFRSISNTKI